MTKPKTKEVKTDGKNTRNTGGAGKQPGGNSGKDGSAANATGSIAGPAASEPVAIGNGAVAPSSDGGGNGNGESIRDPGLDAPDLPKPGRPGRHPGTCECAKCAARRASASEPKARSVKGLALDNKGWAESIFGLHQMLGLFIPLPDIEAVMTPQGAQIQPKMRDGKPVMLMHITMPEAVKLADAAYEVADHYNLAKYFSGKTPALAALVMAAGAIYVPKLMTAKMLIAHANEQKKAQQPKTAADMMHTPPANSTTGNGGVKIDLSGLG